MSWVLTYENVPQTVSNALRSRTVPPMVRLINVLLLIVGTFMDMTPAIPYLYHDDHFASAHHLSAGIFLPASSVVWIVK